MRHSRQIIIYRGFLGAELETETIWCDASNCDNCMVRFQCYTTSGETLVMVFDLEEYDEKLDELHKYKWRLRDGSTEDRRIIKRGNLHLPE